MASRVLPFVSRRTCRVWSSARSHEFHYTSSHNVNSSSKTLQYSSVAVATAPQVRTDSVNGAINAPTAVHDFEDAKGLFSGLTTRELITSLFNLLVSCEPVMDLGMKALKSPLMNYAPYRVLLLKVVKRTVFSHFCAGESIAEASDTLNRMWALGLKGILDYSLEDVVDNAAYDANLCQFLTTVQSTALPPPGSTSKFFLCENHGHLSYCFFEKNQPLAKMATPPSNLHPALEGRGFACSCFVNPTYHTCSVPKPLSPIEENNLISMEKRLFQLYRACEAISLPLLVDAEYTAVQPAIDYFIYRAFSKYNKGLEPLVYGTIQAYLKDALPRLIEASEAAKKQGISMALKLVRGAYITRESVQAKSFGAPSIVHSLITDTHSCYNACTSLMLEKVSRGEASLLLATHNFESAKLVAGKVEELGIMKGGQSRLQFTQLKGMLDSLSLGLVKAGFEVRKYLPFGPVESVMPYLIRRAEENRGMLAATK